MARPAQRHVCQACGASSGKWSGRCEACGAWNTIVEEAPREIAPRGLGTRRGRSIELTTLQGEHPAPPRLATGLGEFDRVCGGGLVAGSALLIGGDPGIGKSTLMLQAAAGLVGNGVDCAYISGEEAIDQVRLRADRLGLAEAPLRLAAATDIRDILATFDAADAPRALVIDSIQTMFVDSLDSAPGTVAQVRASAQELIRLAKRRAATVMLVGHVTKDGQIAGPRVLEHMVDTVLYFEGEHTHQFRILRTVKNRYGPSDEIGVFEMTDRGLSEVANPSALFLGERSAEETGIAVFAGIEGTRPLLVEIQALVAPSPLATPRRTVVGWDAGRLAMVLAVLDARCDFGLTGKDVYLNIAGGLRIAEPAADLAVAAALISSATGVAVPSQSTVFGEIGLSGQIRPVGQVEARLKEASKLGFTRALAPVHPTRREAPLEVVEIARLHDLVKLFIDRAPAKTRRAP